MQSEIVAFGPKSPERVKAEELLKAGVAGDQIDRPTAAKAIGISCGRGQKGESVMQRSVDFLLRHSGPYWEWSRANQSWVCLTDEQMVVSLQARKHKGTRVHAKTLKASEIVNQGNLSADGRRDYQLTQLQCGMAVFAASTKVRNAMLSSAPLEKLRLPRESDLAALMRDGNTGNDA